MKIKRQEWEIEDAAGEVCVRIEFTSPNESLTDQEQSELVYGFACELYGSEDFRVSKKRV